MQAPKKRVSIGSVGICHRLEGAFGANRAVRSGSQGGNLGEGLGSSSQRRFVAPIWSHGSIDRDAADATALGQQLLLSPEIGRDRVRRARALMIEIPASRSRQRVLARGKPALGDAPLMKIV